MVDVTQQDREAAAGMWARSVACCPTWYAIRRGEADAHLYVQVFARHRIAARNAALEEAAATITDLRARIAELEKNTL